MNKSILYVLVITVITAMWMGCTHKDSTQNSATKTTQQSINISGAFAMYPLTVKWAEEYQKTHPDIKFNISAGGAGKGLTDALSGMVDIGMFSRNITDAEKEKGTWYIAVARDAVLPTINSNNPVFKQLQEKGLKKDDFTDIFINEKISSWNDLFSCEKRYQMNIYTRSDACGAAQMWAAYMGYDQENLKGIGIFGDPGIADVIKKDPYGIGYNNMIYIYDIKSGLKYKNLEVIPIDQNENGKIDEEEGIYENLDQLRNAIRNGAYPAPPARDLFFVSKGKPQNKACIEFLEWILSSGQEFIDEAGYVKLPESQINVMIDKIKS